MNRVDLPTLGSPTIPMVSATRAILTAGPTPGPHGPISMRSVSVSRHLRQCLVGDGAVVRGVVYLVGVVFFGLAHGRLVPLRGEDRFLLELRDFMATSVCGDRVPMCNEGGLRTWEPDRSHYRHCCPA